MTDPTPQTWIERHRQGGADVAAIVHELLEQKKTDARNLAAFLRGETPTPEQQENQT